MEQLLCHIFGDFLLQSDWMALNKNKRTIPCLVHVLIYTSVFLLLTVSWKALLVIGVTHFFLDRFPQVLRKAIWVRNHLNPRLEYPPFGKCDSTGYFDDSQFNSVAPEAGDAKLYSKKRLFPITIWLYIIHDNFLHLTINFLALKYL